VSVSVGGGFDPERITTTRDALRSIFGGIDYEVQIDKVAERSVIRCAEIEIPEASDEFLLIERVLRTGFLRPRVTDSFEVAHYLPSAENPSLALRTDFRYLGWKDELFVHRDLVDMDDGIPTRQESGVADRQRIQELFGSIATGSKAQWQEFQDKIALMKTGTVTQIPEAQLFALAG
jgi:hypothetical protein